LAQIDQLLSGATIYTGVATPYGPLPYWWHFGLAKLFGNSVDVFVGSQIVLLALACGVAWLPLSRRLPRGQAVASMLLGILPFQAKILAESIYSPLTALQLAVLVCAWRQPAERSLQRTLALGLLVGIGQWIKFGHFLIFGAGVAAADVAAIVVSGEWRKHWRILLLQWSVVALGAALPELALAVWVGLTRPGAIALDVLWPAYQSQAYGIFGPDERLWGGIFLMPLKPLAARVLPAFALVVASVVLMCIRWGPRKERSGTSTDTRELAAQSALFIPIAAYVAGCFSMFTSTNHLFIYYWLLGWSVPWLWTVLGKSLWTLGAKSLCIGCALLTPVGWISNAMDKKGRWEMPQGEALWLDPETRASFTAVEQYVKSRFPPNAPVLFLHWHGLNHFLSHPAPGRHSYPLPGWVRPHEADSLQAAMQATFAVLAPCHSGNAALREAPSTGLKQAVKEWTQLPEPLRTSVASQAVELEVFDGWMVLWLEKARE
jgi:hypothetical protein